MAARRPVVTVDELRDLLAGPAVTLLDVRWSLPGPPGRRTYEAGHLPGAVFVDLERELAGPPGPGGRHPLPDPAEFTAAMEAAGVDDCLPVVVYDQRDSTSAARLWWLLAWYGHDDVRVLDGGFDAWVAAGGEVETGPGVPFRSAGQDFCGEPGVGGLTTVSADQAAGLARRGVLLDARAPERFRGETEPVDPVAGHVPGAVSAPTVDNVGADGRFLPADVLRARFQALGVDGTRPVGAYCGSGVTATHQVLALRLAGVDAALWPGSWSEWVADPSRPVATGP
jgi:thiosulfate/3-mercaptopyruvate sulfurtransferase